MSITLERRGQRIYLLGDTFAAKDRIKKIGGHWDKDGGGWWVGLTKEEDAKKLAEELDKPDIESGKGLPTASEPDNRWVFSKVRYKGSNWFVIGENHDNNRCKLCKLSGVGFWVDMADCEVVKVYPVKEYRGREEHVTLGSLRKFVAKQDRGRNSGDPQCASCGKYGELHHDLEDGLMKCYGCCDMPE